MLESVNHKKNAVFVAAGRDSLHRQLLKGDAGFDLHLLIYDDSYDDFCNDTEFVVSDSGYKMDMTYRYLHQHPEYLEEYDYFFLMDDDIEMSTEDVNKLFQMMGKYNLKIAQPSLVMSYYTYRHTVNHPLCILRYTNFVEMMVPCFSKEALAKVLPTFEKQVRGCGIEMHWAKLIDSTHKDMAIIDVVHARHVRPLQPWTQDDRKNMLKYLKVHSLIWNVKEYTSILLEKTKTGEHKKRSFDELRILYVNLRQKFQDSQFEHWNMKNVLFLIGFLNDYASLWNDRKTLDLAEKLTEIVRQQNKS